MFKHDILFTNLSKEEAEQKEIQLIRTYDSTNDTKGYNITNGGGSHNFVITEEWLVKLKGHKAWNKGIKHRQETKNKISKATKSLWETEEHRKHHLENYKNGMTGNHHSEESKQKIREKLAYKMTPIYKFDLSGNIVCEYVSLKECSEKNNVSNKAIRLCCSGDTKVCNNSIFIYKRDYTKKLLMERILNAEKARRKKNE